MWAGGVGNISTLVATSSFAGGGVPAGTVSSSAQITAFGFIIYLGEKKLEYGEEFSFMNFIIGNPICKGYTPPYSIKNNVKALVS